MTIEDNDVGSSSNTVNVTVSPSTINDGSASSLTLYYFLTGDATNYTDYRDQATGDSLSGSTCS